MRKGYGPTGISFTYTKEMFAEACFAAPLRVELIFNGNTSMVEMDMTGATSSEITALYDAIDCTAYDDVCQHFVMYAGGN